MALTLTTKKRGTAGDLRYLVADCAFDNSYATGGLALTATTLGYPSGTVQLVLAGSTGGYVFSYDYTNSKLLAYRQKDPAAAGGADIPLPEVANATDLHTVTCRLIVFVTGS